MPAARSRASQSATSSGGAMVASFAGSRSARPGSAGGGAGAALLAGAALVAGGELVAQAGSQGGGSSEFFDSRTATSPFRSKFSGAGAATDASGVAERAEQPRAVNKRQR